MNKTCARCGAVLGVISISDANIPDPWYCPNCENKKEEPMHHQLLAKYKSLQEHVAKLSDPDWVLVKRLEVQSIYCRYCSLWTDAGINGGCNCDAWHEVQQGIAGMRDNASS
jgi:hypothetical protein